MFLGINILSVTFPRISQTLAAYGFMPKKIKQVPDVVKFLNMTEPQSDVGVPDAPKYIFSKI